MKGSGNFNESAGWAYTASDFRFTTKGETLYATALAWPDNGELMIATLAQGRTEYPKRIGRVELLGHNEPLVFERQAMGLVVTMPDTRPNGYAYVLKVRPA